MHFIFKTQKLIQIFAMETPQKLTKRNWEGSSFKCPKMNPENDSNCKVS